MDKQVSEDVISTVLTQLSEMGKTVELTEEATTEFGERIRVFHYREMEDPSKYPERPSFTRLANRDLIEQHAKAIAEVVAQALPSGVGEVHLIVSADQNDRAPQDRWTTAFTLNSYVRVRPYQSVVKRFK